MENDVNFIENDVVNGNSNSFVNDFDNSSDIYGELEAQADYYYDYRSYLQTIISNQNTIIIEIKKNNDIFNAGFTTLLFCLISAFCYVLVKNYIRK